MARQLHGPPSPSAREWGVGVCVRDRACPCVARWMMGRWDGRCIEHLFDTCIGQRPNLVGYIYMEQVELNGVQPLSQKRH